jgi:hypothetical protein
MKRPAGNFVKRFRQSFAQQWLAMRSFLPSRTALGEDLNQRRAE